MLEAYLDESGIHDKAHVCVIAGYWAGEKRWRSFEKEWNKILRDTKTPKLIEFHAREFWGLTKGGKRIGIYEHWSDDQADRFLNALLGCIKSHKVYPFGFVLKISAWKSLNKAERMFLTGGRYDRKKQQWITPSAPNKTYYLPFQLAVVNPAMTCKGHLTVHYVFDLNKQFKEHAMKLFELIKKDETVKCRDRIGEIAMSTSDSAPGLQAADLLAYQTYQLAWSRIQQSKPVKIREANPVLQAALQNMRSDHDFGFLDEQGLEISLEPLPTSLRT